jgi:hypothetical protein
MSRESVSRRRDSALRGCVASVDTLCSCLLVDVASVGELRPCVTAGARNDRRWPSRDAHDASQLVVVRSRIAATIARR